MASEMGVLDGIRARRVDMSERVQFVDRNGDLLAELPDTEFNDCPDDTEIPREDLAHVLLRTALSPTTELRFGESITALHDDGDGVDVQFASGERQRYDVVVGADGMHSATRRLTFGPKERFLRHLGLYVALADLPGHIRQERHSAMYNYPGRMAGIATYRDKALAVFMFRAPWIDYDYHDPAAQQQILRDAFAGHAEWKIPELLDAACRDPELYFDSVSQIHMPSWHRGRVVLVGDSAYCASPLSGRGTSLAMTGAWLLAEALREHRDDVAAAFRQYERDQLPHVTYAQGTAGPGGDVLVPATQEEIDARNQRLVALTA
ncbi:FAD-dependent monooxygenase [Mycobacterium kiyosense]|nr:FAD-dependent oxidoreductase [Mycobacterium kiyosense]